MSVVDEVKSRLDIVDVVAAYVPSLKKAGQNYKGLCPFHSEKTPSFVVSPDRQTWRCFGACNEGGDIFSFLMRREGLTFREALQTLAERAGVPLSERNPAETEADQYRRKLLDLVATAAEFFHQQLTQHPAAASVRTYVQNRGLDSAIVHRFQLGYAPQSWDALRTYLGEKGYAVADMVAAGLLIERDDKSSTYDRFRHRLVVPIRDVQGRVLGFGARALDQDQQPKYLNSPQSSLFDKSKIVYGLDVARAAIRETGQVVIVEGYMDALQAHQQGFANVVAQMGTALTEEQLKQLKRYTSTFILALDADNAGSAATLRGLNVARQSLRSGSTPVPTADGRLRYQSQLDADLRVVALPPGQDPDDVLKTGPEAWQTLVDGAAPLVDYYIKSVAADLDLTTPQGKSEAVRSIIPVLQELSDRVVQEHYLQQLSALVKIDERTLRAELERIDHIKPARSPKVSAAARVSSASTSVTSSPSNPVRPITSPKSSKLEDHCLATLLGCPEVLYQANQTLVRHELDVVATTDFQHSDNAALFMVIKNWAEAEDPDLGNLSEQVPDVLEIQLANLMDLQLSQPPQTTEYWLKHFLDLILRNRLTHIKDQHQALAALQKEDREANSNGRLKDYLSKQTALQTQRRKLEQVMNDLSITGRRRSENRLY